MKKHQLLTLLQLMFIAGLLFQKVGFAKGYLLFFQAFSIFIAIWAFFQFRLADFSIYPKLKEGAQLIKTGPYRFIKNPMYFSLILFFGSSIIENGNKPSYLLYSCLFIILILKARMEEKELKTAFSKEYDYFKSTKSLIPFIY